MYRILMIPVLLAVLVGAGCSCRKAVKQEVQPLVERVEKLAKRIDSLEKRWKPGRGATASTPREESTPSPPEAAWEDLGKRLVGTWVSDEVDTKAGPTINTVTFREDRTVTIETRSTLPFLGHLRTTEGSYQVSGDTLSSESIEGGTAVKFWFEGNDLFIRSENGTTIHLHPA